jgi:hypothetical protein
MIEQEGLLQELPAFANRFGSDLHSNFEMASRCSVQCAQAMLLLAIPGMIGEAVVLSHLATFMPRLQATSGGKYGAFLFATYALVLGIAEIVTLRAAS